MPPIPRSPLRQNNLAMTSQKTVNLFVDIEAEEDTRENADILNDTEGESEFDNCIDDCEVAPDKAENEVPGEEEEDLGAYVCEHQPEYQRPAPKCFDDRLKPLPPALLYRVRVKNSKDGYEETAAMVLGNKLLTAGTHFAPSIKSIIGRVSCPGWVFIESNRADASKLCVNISNVYPRHIHPIVKDLQQYLHEPLVMPKEGDWVCLHSPPQYCGDLAYVCAYNDRSADHLTTKHKNPGGKGADILVVPHIERFVNRTKGKGMAKFSDGLLYLVTHEFEPTVPTHEELALFQCRSFIDPDDIASTTNKMAALSLQVTDRVVVTSGELITMTGTILEFSGNDKEATICLDSTKITMDIVLSPSLLHKVVRVADRVRVVRGAGDGRVGWVVAVDGTELHVWEDKTALPFKVNINCVTFHHDAQALMWVVPKQDVSWKPSEENPHPPPHRNLVYLGWRVMVIRRGVFKGYEGIIREILKDDEVHVELSATLKHETFHLSQLSNLNDDKRKPLIYKYHPKVFQGDMPLPTQPVPIPQSLIPLTPLTPLPAGSSTDMGPSWNPLSRTPDSHLQFHKLIVTLVAPYLI
ncbi:hypothetical protein DXG01_006148 [Tephrocybe rancida]|nr:hypothetical protein DXG01_006148 [Tephrocybe rancida]